MTTTLVQKFPLVSHPLSRLGSGEALSVTGVSRDDSKSVDWSIVYPLPQSAEGAYSRNVAGRNDANNDSTNQRRSSSCDSRRISTEEVLQVIEERLRSGNFHLVKKLFRSNDPTGEGKVTKEAFSRILWHLCGYLSPRSINQVLNRLGMKQKNAISFEDLIERIRRPCSRRGRSENGFRLSSSMQPRSASLHCHAKAIPQEQSDHTPEDAAEQSWEAFKAKAAKGDLDFRGLLPPMCFGESAYIIPGQLKECFLKLGIPANDVIVARILSRLDGGSLYAIHTTKLFHHLGLRPDGKRSSCHHANEETELEKEERETRHTTNRENVTTRPGTSQCFAANHPPATPTTVNPRSTLSLNQLTSSSSHVRPRTSLGETQQLFEGDVIEFIAKKLDEGSSHFFRALESRDVNSSGVISKAELRHIIRKLGVNITATNLEHFLSRNGLRRHDGLVDYRLLLRRIQTRSSKGLLNKVVWNPDHVFHDDILPTTPSEGITAPLLERKLLDIFQKEFLGLLSAFKEMDKSDTGILKEGELKFVIESRYRLKISPTAWELFLTSSHVSAITRPNQKALKDLYLSYNDFLEKFDVAMRPSTVGAEDPWNKEEEDLSGIQEHRERYLRNMHADPADHTHRHEPRSLEQLEAALLDVFLYKFHNFKKEYDVIVREDFCRIDKEKFDYILFRCGFILTPSELSRLWLSMPITRPMESVSMPTILQQVMRLYYTSLQPGKFNKVSRDSAIVSRVLEKIRVPIVTHWNILKKKLRYLDPMGTSRIEKGEMLRILKGLSLTITELELHYLLEMLESRISGKTNYFRLMEYFVKNPMKRMLSQNESRAPQLSSGTLTAQRKRYGGRPLPKQHDYQHPDHLKKPFITLRNAPLTPPFKRVNVQPGVSKSPVCKGVINTGCVSTKRSSFADFRGQLESLVRQTTSDSSSSNKRCVSTKRSSFADFRGQLESLVRQTTSDSSSSNKTSESLVRDQVKPHVGARDLPGMGRAMKSEDVKDCGRISVEAFMKILAKYGVSFASPNEMYKLLSRYDRKMRDEISYDRFLSALAATRKV